MAGRAKTLDPSVFTIDDLKRLGSMRLSRTYQEFFNEGAMDLISLRRNEEAYTRYMLRPRILLNVSSPDTSTTVFGVKVALPLGFSPAAMHRIAHPEGELATSRAAANANVCMAISSYATVSVEDIIAQGGGNPYCFQICIMKDRSIVQTLIQRAERAGCKALLVSVDVPTLGRRLNEMRNDFRLPKMFALPNIPAKTEEIIDGTHEGIRYDDSVEWATLIPWLRSQTTMQIWLKGVMTAEDVQLAVDYKVDGVIISNHGGRQLDGTPASVDVLEECVPIAANKIGIAIDGGIRRGSDIFKALALGAQYCFVGRVPIWGLAYNGQEGVALALEMLTQEFRNVMQLSGCRTVKDITRSHLAVLGNNGRLLKL